MKTPGILTSIVFALLTSLVGGISGKLLPIFFSTATSSALIVISLSLAYLIFLLKHAEARRGRVMVPVLWVCLSIGGWLLGLSLVMQLLLQLSIIWMVRSLYFHASILTALLDLVLIVMATAAGVWALIQTGSFMAAVWCFFLAQSLFVAIPEFSGRIQQASNPITDDHFQNAHRVAQEAVRKLSLN